MARMTLAVTSRLIGFSDIADGFPMATCWNAMGMDPQGNVYIVMSTNKKLNPEDCLVLKYNPQTGERKNLGTFIDAARAADNYRDNEPIPKGHSNVPYFDGTMYIGSQPFHERNKWDGMDLGGYRGSHMYTVDVTTGELVDISADQPDGVFQQRQGIIGLDAMPGLGLIVAMSHPYGDLLFYDPDQGTVVRKVDGPSEGQAGEPVGRCVLTAPDGKVFFALGWNDYHMYVYDYHSDKLTKTGSTFREGFWNGMAKTCDGSRGWVMTSRGYLYEIDFDNDNADYKGRFGTIDESFCLTMSPDETKLYTVPSKAGDCDGDLVEYDIASGDFNTVKDLGGDGDGWITGFNLRDDKHIYFSKNSNDHDGYILQIDVSDRSGPRPAGCEGGGGAELPKPVVHLDFDDVSGTTINDVSGNGHDATAHGGARFVDGVDGKGLDFDGEDDYADLSFRLPRQGSIALWYYPHRLYNYNTVFDNSVHENDWEMWIQGENIDEPWYECPYCWKFRQGGNEQARDVGRVNQDIREIGGDKMWHHAVVSWDESGATTLYLNGVLRDQAVSESFADPGDHIYLGSNNPGNPRGNGIMDDFMVFDTVLSASDVSTLYGSYTQTPSDPPMPPPSGNDLILSASHFLRDGSCYEWNADMNAVQVPVGSTGQSCEANATFTGSSGTYTVRLSVVAEDDGQSRYRVSIDGAQGGRTYTAPLVSGERSVVIAEGVVIGEGATITVWSENGGSAWGRWTEVSFEPVEVTAGAVALPATRFAGVALRRTGALLLVDSPEAIRTVRVVTLAGRTIAIRRAGAGMKRIRLPLGAVAPGTCLIEVTTDTGVSIVKGYIDR
jgi:hypothetical protein